MCTAVNLWMALLAAIIIVALLSYICAQIHAAFFEETDE